MDEMSNDEKMNDFLKWIIGFSIVTMISVPIIGLITYSQGAPVIITMTASLGSFNGMLVYSAYKMRKKLYS